jgi:TatD DNase family protein
MLIDSHCHLPHKKYGKPLERVINDAKEAGVVKLINIGTSLQNNLEILEVSSEFENVYSAIAIYPHDDLDKPLDVLRNELDAQLDLSKKIVAVGECGLDITDWQGGRPIDDQIPLFEMQLELAIKHKLPIAIHNRNGDNLVMDILDKYVSQNITGVIHCFSSDWEVAKKYLDRGFYISFSGMLTYKGRKELHETVKNIPLDRFLVETDAPYLPPEGFRGQPNEPKLVVEVAKKFAEIRNEEFDKIADLSYSNTCKLFVLN